MPAFLIRVATINDAEAIAHFSRQSFCDTFAVSNTAADMEKFLAEQFAVKDLVAEVGAPGNTFLVAYEGNDLKGYARLREGGPDTIPVAEPAIEIARLYVHKDSIGTGLGARLMQACLDKGRDMGKTLIWLGVWEHNHRAIAFYQRWQFEKFGNHAFLLGDDVQTDWLMKRAL